MFCILFGGKIYLQPNATHCINLFKMETTDGWSIYDILIQRPSHDKDVLQ